MKLTIGEHAGFCFGVRRAVLKAFECAEKQLPCVTLGPLIHNPQEVERLRRRAFAAWKRWMKLRRAKRSSSAAMA